MSGVIKHGGTAPAIVRLAARRSDVTAPRDPVIVALEQRIDALEREGAEERRAARHAAEQQADEARRAVAAAHAAGRAEAVADDAALIAAIEKGVAEALSAWRTRLIEVDRLAAQLAAAVLARVFGDAADMADLVTRVLAQQVAAIGAQGIVGVAVSAADFSDPTLLAAQVALPGAAVTCSADLPAGACRIALRLGQVEVDPLMQWAAFERVLREMAHAGEQAA